MVWFDIKELERGLRNGDVSDRMVFNYLLASLIITSLASYIADQDDRSVWFVVAEIGAMFTIVTIGTKATYDINSTGDGRDYFRRYLSLSFVTGIRLVVFCVPAGIAVGIVVYFVNKVMPSNAFSKDLFTVMLVPAVGIWYYFMLANSFRRVSQ